MDRKTIKRFFLDKLWKKFAFFLLLLITTPIVLLGYFLIREGEKAVRKSVLTNYREIVGRVADEVSSLVETPKELLLAASQIISLSAENSSWDQETILVEFTLRHPMFLRMISLDLAGNIMASSNLQEADSAKKNYLQEAFDIAKQGENFFSQIKIAEEHFPFMVMAVPVIKEGEVSAVLLAEVNLQNIWDVVDAIHIGKSGEISIVSDTGILVANLDKKRVFSNEDLSKNEEVQAVLRGEYQAVEKKDYIYSYKLAQSLGWGIIFKQTKEEAYFFSKTMKIQSIIILFLGELLAVTISVLLSEILALPLKKLLRQMQYVSRGDLDHLIDNQREDEIGELIDTFNDMVTKLKAARQKERLAAVGEASLRISHEFKNSLCSIKSFMQLFPRRYNDKEFIEKFKKNIPKEMERWEGLLKELSEYTKDIKLVKDNIGVKRLIDDLVILLREQCEERDIYIDVQINREDFVLYVDRERIREVLLNILLNAIQAIGNDGKISVLISEETELKNHLKIEIIDTGIGIGKEDKEKIFEPFFSTKKSGLGLGLSFCKKIVELHSGEISINSTIGKGTTFKLLLPSVKKI